MKIIVNGKEKKLKSINDFKYYLNFEPLEIFIYNIF